MSNKTYYSLNAEGAIAGSFASAPPADLGLTVIHAAAPPEAMLKPRWIANAWQDTATKSEHEAAIDASTDRAVQEWCASRGKNEAYYINLGIEVVIRALTGDGAPRALDTSDPDYRSYKAYRDFIASQKQIAKTKKEKLS